MATISNLLAQPAHAHFDAEALRKLRGAATRGNEDAFVANMLDRFLSTTPERLQTLCEAAAAGDCETIEFQAHTLKSSCGYVGAIVMTEICKTLESRARAGDCAEAVPLVAELQASFALVAPRLEAMLAQSGRGAPQPDGCRSVDG